MRLFPPNIPLSKLTEINKRILFFFTKGCALFLAIIIYLINVFISNGYTCIPYNRSFSHYFDMIFPAFDSLYTTNNKEYLQDGTNIAHI